jgi:transposase
MRITEILRLRELGLSYKEIATGAGVGKSTVGDVLRLCKGLGVDYEVARAMGDEELQNLLYPAYYERKRVKAEPDYEAIRQALSKDKHTNLRFIWEEEYRKEHPDGLGYSQFCERYRRYFKLDALQNVTMHQEREPGKELYVDWMGEAPLCVADPETGELKAAHFFVAALGSSGYPYVEAFPDETLPSWIGAHVRAFEYFGGLPKILIPDNCKTAVKSPNYYDPELNPAYRELAEHYGVAVLPARVKSPRDKSIVEKDVGWLETWLLGKIRGQHFLSFGELNRFVCARMAELVKRPFQKLEGSRLSVFLEEDKPVLRPLPTRAFEIADMALRRVPDNYHVEYGGFYYSVPYTLYKRQVTLRATERMIEIFSADRKRVAVHVRRRQGKRYVTEAAHMPPHHRAVHEQRGYDGKRYISWAKKVGAETERLIHALLEAAIQEEQAYRSCMGVLQLGNKYGIERLEAACQKAFELKSPVYVTVRNILKNGTDLAFQPTQSAPLPAHENLRGGAYYV